MLVMVFDTLRDFQEFPRPLSIETTIGNWLLFH